MVFPAAAPGHRPPVHQGRAHHRSTGRSSRQVIDHRPFLPVSPHSPVEGRGGERVGQLATPRISKLSVAELREKNKRIVLGEVFAIDNVFLSYVNI